MHPAHAQLELLRADTTLNLPLPLAVSSLSCGFPSPAEDYLENFIDLNRTLIKDKEATFYGRVRGNSMEDANIHEGDILVIDRSLQAKSNNIVLCALNGEFTVKRLIKRSGSITLYPANPKYQPIPITPEMDFAVWGVVTYIIHKAQ